MPTKRALSPLHAQLSARLEAGQGVDDLMDLLDHRELAALCECPRPIQNALIVYLARTKKHSLDKYSLLARGLVEGAVRSARGRIVALFCLHGIGRALPNASAIYAQLLDDRSEAVLDSALFAMALLQTPECEQAIQQRIPGAAPSRRGRMERALAAIRARDHREYSPGFVDGLGVW